MDKTTQKRKTYNAGILIALAKKYGFSIDYIRKCLRGDRPGVMPDQIIKEYKLLEKEANDIENQAQAQIEEKANNIK